MDWQEAYLATLDDLHVARIRLPLYWSDIEPAAGEMHWDAYDWMVQEAEAHHVALTVVVGAKVPRWPECYIPEWAAKESPEDRLHARFDFVTAAVERYRASPAVVRWQVENEPTLPFGECAAPNTTELREEVALVRSLDARPIQLTVSGELESWGGSAVTADVLGFSLYHTVWSPVFGYITYPIPPLFYRMRAWAVSHLVESVIISELQAEPWFTTAAGPDTSTSMYDAFTAEDLRGRVAYARATHLSEAYLWGVEWWYFLREHGEARLWDAARELFTD